MIISYSNTSETTTPQNSIKIHFDTAWSQSKVGMCFVVKDHFGRILHCWIDY